MLKTKPLRKLVNVPRPRSQSRTWFLHVSERWTLGREGNYERRSNRIGSSHGGWQSAEGTLRTTRPDEMGATVIKEAVGRVPGLETSKSKT